VDVWLLCMSVYDVIRAQNNTRYTMPIYVLESGIVLQIRTEMYLHEVK
jgi:hypothetical protein